MDTRFIGIIILAVVVVFVGLLSVSLLDNSDNSKVSILSISTTNGAQAGFLYQAKMTVANWYRTLFGFQPLPVLPDTQSCQLLWWFDNRHAVCQQKSFCGTYMYQGLRTFKTQEECKNAWAVSGCELRWWYDDTHRTCQQKSFCGSYVYLTLRTFNTKTDCENSLSADNSSTKERACISSGGTVTTSSCCKTTKNFPNLCAIGACGCSPTNSHQVKICNCGTGKCFNGTTCVSR